MIRNLFINIFFLLLGTSYSISTKNYFENNPFLHTSGIFFEPLVEISFPSQK